MENLDPYDVFVSYAWADQKWAKPLAEAIHTESNDRENGPWRVFLDTEELHSSDYWRSRIIAEVDCCKTFIAVLSPAYMESYNAKRMCFHEYETAMHRELKGECDVLFQVLYRQTALTSTMERKQYQDLCGVAVDNIPLSAEFRKLMDDLERRIGRYDASEPKYYIINSDAGSLPSSPHDIWIKQGLAFTGGERHYGELLGKLSPNDILFLYVNKSGIVAIGKVLEKWDGKAYNQGQMVYNNPVYTEYCIKIDWFLELHTDPISSQEIRDVGGAVIPQTLWKIKSEVGEALLNKRSPKNEEERYEEQY